jgi:hypothetical protein
MAAYKVHFKVSVEKDLAIIPKKDLKRSSSVLRGSLRTQGRGVAES